MTCNQSSFKVTCSYFSSGGGEQNCYFCLPLLRRCWKRSPRSITALAFRCSPWSHERRHRLTWERRPTGRSANRSMFIYMRKLISWEDEKYLHKTRRGPSPSSPSSVGTLSYHSPLQFKLDFLSCCCLCGTEGVFYEGICLPDVSAVWQFIVIWIGPWERWRFQQKYYRRHFFLVLVYWLPSPSLIYSRCHRGK